MLHEVQGGLGGIYGSFREFSASSGVIKGMFWRVRRVSCALHAVRGVFGGISRSFEVFLGSSGGVTRAFLWALEDLSCITGATREYKWYLRVF